jgi:6-pyruvoyltetrahydropterin/6-carboxytetrahydropterin synthase
MSVTRLHRVVRFHAVHHYRRADWSPEENARVFGELTRSHGHDYAVRVTVSGEPDPATGFLVDLTALDAVLDGEVRAVLHGSDLNQVLPGVSRGEEQPSCEVLARWVWSRIEGRLPAGTELERVQVWESDDLGGEVASR